MFSCPRALGTVKVCAGVCVLGCLCVQGVVRSIPSEKLEDDLSDNSDGSDDSDDCSACLVAERLCISCKGDCAQSL